MKELKTSFINIKFLFKIMIYYNMNSYSIPYLCQFNYINSIILSLIKLTIEFQRDKF